MANKPKTAQWVIPPITGKVTENGNRVRYSVSYPGYWTKALGWFEQHDATYRKGR